MNEERKIVQIAFKPDVIDDTHYTDTYALADDGTVWCMNVVSWGHGWHKVDPLPPIEEPEGDEGK